jgi:ligand-binding SRPBCC domain-containing protein
MQPPAHFRDIMTEGDFAILDHSHRFEFFNGKTIMRDVLYYESPLGLLGVIADQLFVKAYMRRFLQQRNRFLKAAAESDLWKQYVEIKPASPVELLPVNLPPARRVGCAE